MQYSNYMLYTYVARYVAACVLLLLVIEECYLSEASYSVFFVNITLLLTTIYITPIE